MIINSENKEHFFYGQEYYLKDNSTVSDLQSDYKINEKDFEKIVFASNNSEVKAVLLKYQNKDIKNINDGILIRFSSTGREKMLSKKARDKSISNGFSQIEHSTAVVNIPYLFMNSIKVEERPDLKGGNKNITIAYYEKKIVFSPSNHKGYARILVKKINNIGNRIYTVELIDLNKEKSSRLSGKLSEEEVRALDSIISLPSEAIEVNQCKT